MCRDIRFGVCLDSLSKDKTIIGGDAEKNILSLLDEQPNLFVSFTDLGISEDDVFNPEYFVPISSDDSMEFNSINLKITNLYRYVSDEYGSSNYGSNSRDFCITLAKRSNASMLPYQSIISLNSSNPGQGPNGSDTYSIFDWRGGKNCLHYWVKYFYDTETKNLVKAPSGNQPTQVVNSNGGVPGLPGNK